MRSHLTMMIGETSSTKHYTIDPTTDTATKGKVKVDYLYDSQVIPLDNIIDLFKVIEYVREEPRAYIIRGRTEEEYKHKVRRTLFNDEANTDPNFMEVGTAWICCDFDQYEVPDTMLRTSKEAIEYLIATYLPKCFHNVTYVYQWSASAGLEYKDVPVKSGTNVHLFFYLNKLLTYQNFKDWLDPQIALGLDSSTFRTTTPIFVNTNVTKDMRIIDTIAEEDKFGLVTKDLGAVVVPIIKPRLQKPFVAKSLQDFDYKNQILNDLQAAGAILKRGQGYIKLWHPTETSKGDWFVYTKDPRWVKHHVKKAVPVYTWLKQYWGIEDAETAARDHAFKELTSRLPVNNNKI